MKEERPPVVLSKLDMFELWLRNSREHLHYLGFVKVLGEASKEASDGAKESFNKMQDMFPDYELQVKAIQEAISFLEDTILEEKRLAARMKETSNHG